MLKQKSTLECDFKVFICEHVDSCSACWMLGTLLDAVMDSCSACWMLGTLLDAVMDSCSAGWMLGTSLDAVMDSCSAGWMLGTSLDAVTMLVLTQFCQACRSSPK